MIYTGWKQSTSHRYRGEEEEVKWCGLPDGGIGEQAWWRGWEEEVGSEEEVEETVALRLEGTEMDESDLSIRSHILVAVMQAAVKDRHERERFLGELERRMMQKGRISEERAGRWAKEALGIMEPYVRIWQGVWPGAEERGRCCGGSWWRMRSSLHAGGCHLFRSSSLLSWGRGSKGFRLPLRPLYTIRQVCRYVCTYRVKHLRSPSKPIYILYCGSFAT
jgi:hypothetical protein